MRVRHGGVVMSAVLYVVFIVLLFGLMLATLASFQYQLGHDSISRGSSYYAAQSGLSQSIYNLSCDPTWGMHQEALSGSVASDGSRWNVSFKPGTAPWSSNNLQGNKGVPGWQGQIVPANSALVVSQGITQPGTYPRTIESIVQYAPYPYAIAASNLVTSGGPLMVSGASTLTLSLARNSDIAGHVYAGSSSPDAVTGTSGSIITGKVRTPGGASFGAGAQIAGGIDAGCSAESLPDVDIATYSNASNPLVVNVAAGTTLVGPVAGFIHANGDLTLDAATLINAYIYVDNGGNLTSNGALLGTGSIFVTGKARIEGAVNADAASGIAIFSQGDLIISSGQLFQGVLYTHGNMTVSAGITVLGAVLAQSNSGAGNVALESGASVIYVPEFTQFGNSWTSHQMQGSLLAGNPPLMRTIFSREYQP